MNQPDVSTEAMSLQEVAVRLGISISAVRLLAEQQHLPGQCIAGEWSFQKPQIDQWIAHRGSRSSVAGAAGAWASDPYFDNLLENIYRDRGRPMVEGS